MTAASFGCPKAAPTPAAVDDSPAHRAKSNAQLEMDARVVLLTLDGVRWQEFFDLPKRTMTPIKSRPLLDSEQRGFYPRGTAQWERAGV